MRYELLIYRNRGQLAARCQRLGRLLIFLLAARFRLPIFLLHFLLALPQQHFQKLLAIIRHEPQPVALLTPHPKPLEKARLQTVHDCKASIVPLLRVSALLMRLSSASNTGWLSA